MIFVTVGTELPFDRMMQVVDGWVARTGRTDVFAQIGQKAWTPQAMSHRDVLDPAEFAARFAEASVIISHAGMGTILSALHAAKPILVMPRLASLGEQRNEHQLATARRMRAMGKVAVAFDEAEMLEELGRIEKLQAGQSIQPYADRSLTDAIHQFIFHGGR